MTTETESVQLNLGLLRSAMSLTLHTHHASRVWHGRPQGEGRHGIMGLNGFVAIMNRLRRGAEQDDPYSDWWMIRIEEKLADTKQRLREQVDQALADVPATLSLGENLNVQPVKLPCFVSSQLGFMAVYLPADYYDVARRLLLAHHTALALLPYRIDCVSLSPKRQEIEGEAAPPAEARLQKERKPAKAKG